MDDGQRGFGKKRKKRRSLLQQAKKYGNKGCYGRGSDLPEDVFQYLVRVLELSRETFDTLEDKEIFANNSFNQFEGEEINYSSNQLGSRVVETLLPLANDEIINKFLTEFGNNLREMCMDRFASHVLQKLIFIASDRGSRNVKNSEDVTAKIQEYDNWLLKTSKFILNNFEEFIWHPYANHVFRSILECLGGFTQGETTGRSKKWGTAVSTNNTQTRQVLPKNEISQQFKHLLKESTQQITSWPQLQELPYNDLTSGLLQTVLYVAGTGSKTACNELVRELLDKCFTFVHVEFATEDKEKKMHVESEESATLDVFYSESASRVLDAAIAVASPKRFTQIYAKCFINNLGKLSVMPIANYQVQRLFQHCSDKTEFEAMFEEIRPSLNNIFENRAIGAGVIVSVAQACKRLSAKQGFFMEELMNILHCKEPEDRQVYFAPLLAKMKTYEEYKDNPSEETVSLQGSLLLQTLLSFNKPIKVVNSLLEMNTEELKGILCDPKGSHVANVYMTSESIGEKSREKMFRKLQGSFVALACSKHGSRTLDVVWSVMDLKYKLKIMEELSPKEVILNSNTFGKILAYNYKLPLFKHRPDDWKDDQGKTNRKRKLFEEIIGDLEKKSKL